MKRTIISIFLIALATAATAQTIRWYQTTPDKNWQVSKISLSAKARYGQPMVQQNDLGVEFKAFGTTFNELDYLALQRLTPEVQDDIFRRLFAPDGDLRLTRGRISMNANDYGNGWYSCDTVAGDFDLRYFNIERDKQTLLPMIHHAQKYQPNLRLWMSPWSPPAWMKINQDYPVLSSKYNKQPKEKDYMLFSGVVDPDEERLLDERNDQYPRRLATQNYFIQDDRYLQAYANMFCKFIDLYAAEGAPIDMVMYQNEAYSYTPYPGCAWTAEGTIRFNRDYMAPTLKRLHPEVKLYLGTFNTNRRDYVEKIVDGLTVSDKSPSSSNKIIEGLGFQWEARENLAAMRQRYPELKLICSESECGNGSMDWNAAEHTFFLLSDNLGNGITEYYNWNFILQDNGRSSWGWTQNALIQVDSKTNKHRLTQEYYAFMHFSHFITEGTRLLAYNKQGLGERQRSKDVYTLLFQTKEGKHVVTAANFADDSRNISVQMGRKFLNVALPAHSLNTFVE